MARFLSAAVPAAQAGETPALPGTAHPPNLADRVLWLSFSACGSSLLLATTNQLSFDVAAVPFLWIVPLSLYLLSFIICFDREKWYWRPLWSAMLPLALGLAATALILGVYMPLALQILVYSLALFFCCMICHGELARLKPNPRYLTGFYLLVAAGGALGGLAITLAAPALFSGYWEYPLSLLACYLLLLIALYRDPHSAIHRGRPRWVWGILALSALGLLCALGAFVRNSRVGVVAVSRNFYGVLKVENAGEPNHPGYLLVHGRITHGFQFLEEERRRWPTSYYGRTSGIGVAYQACRERNEGGVRLGVVGLGTGSIAAYGQAGDSLRFYEINPEVVRLSDKYFSYRRDCPAAVQVALGDARVSLEREQSQGFDILAVDAFSSDSIPLHLLTREAFSVYWRHLKPEGVLALHVSNRYLDLTGLARGLAVDAGCRAVLISNPEITEEKVYSSTWVLIARDPTLFELECVKEHIDPWPDNAPPPLVFTDDYSNLFAILKKR